MNNLLLYLKKHAQWIVVLLSASLAVASYLQAINYPFVSDDIAYIVLNTKLATLNITDLWRIFTEPYNWWFEFVPLRDLSNWLDIRLFGFNPTAFRLHNIILFLFCVPLVFAVTLRIWQYCRPEDTAGAPWAAAATASLFALHPALVESVVWISGYKYILPDFFALLALWLAISAKREYGLSIRHSAAAVLAFVAMMLSKATFVGVAPIITLLWLLFWFDVPVQRRRRLDLLWPVGLMILAGILTLIFIAKNKGFESVPFYYGVEAVERSLAILGGSARLAYTPESRHFFYPLFEDQYFPAMVAGGAIFLVAAIIGLVMLFRKRSLEGFALVAFVLLCMPYMQLTPTRPPSLIADRYISPAVWPAMLLLVALIWRFKPISTRTILLLIVAFSLGIQTVERPHEWRGLKTLIEADSRAYPGYYLPVSFEIILYQLPKGMFREAYETASNISDSELRAAMKRMIEIYLAVHVDSVRNGNPQEAMALLHQLFLELKQLPAQAQWDTPIHRLWKLRRDALAGEWRFLAKTFPNNVWVRFNAGQWMLDDGRYQNSVIFLRAALESQELPENMRGPVYKDLGFALIESGNVPEAETPLRLALIQSPPDYEAYCYLSKVYAQSGRREDAAQAETSCRIFAPDWTSPQLSSNVPSDLPDNPP